MRRAGGTWAFIYKSENDAISDRTKRFITRVVVSAHRKLTSSSRAEEVYFLNVTQKGTA
jgi:hypothetical protein